MSILNKIIKSLLIEDVSIDKINHAISNTYEVEINYHSKGENIASGKRVIQPVAYGLTKLGNPVIRAFQPYGDTTTKVPSWKFFRIDRISKWVPNYLKKFKEPPGMFNAEGNFNPNGDKTMSIVYTIANFNKNNQNSVNKIGPLKKDDVFKTDTEKGIEHLRKQLENPNYISNKNIKNNFGPKLKNNINNNSKSEPINNGPLKKDDVFKTDTEKGIEHLRKQLENPNYITDIVKNNMNRKI